MNFEIAKLQAAQPAKESSGAQLHLRLPTWDDGWTAEPFGLGGLAWPTMPMFYHGDYYGRVRADPAELDLPTWEVVEVVETGNNTLLRPNQALDFENPPHRALKNCRPPEPPSLRLV